MGKAVVKGVMGMADLSWPSNLESFYQKSVLILDSIQMIDHWL